MRKGLGYTLFTLAIISSLIMLINIQQSTIQNTETPTKIRSSLMLNTINDISKDLERSSYIATKRAALSLVDITVTNGTYIVRPEYALQTLSINGSYNNTYPTLMTDTTIEHWTERIQTILSELGIENNLTLISYNATLTDLYDIKLDTIYQIEIYDPHSKIRIEKNTTINITVDYYRFEDPINTINSNLIFSTAYELCNMSGGYGKALTDKTNATIWTVGKSYKALDQSDISSMNENQKNGKILITHNASQFAVSDINEFKGVISETSDDPGITIPFIKNTGDCYTTTNNNKLIAMSTEIDMWLNNIETDQGTTCFIENDLAPTFFDRLEGNLTRGKYPGPGLATFIDTTILPKKTQQEIDFIYWS